MLNVYLTKVGEYDFLGIKTLASFFLLKIRITWIHYTQLSEADNFLVAILNHLRCRYDINLTQGVALHSVRCIRKILAVTGAFKQLKAGHRAKPRNLYLVLAHCKIILETGGPGKQSLRISQWVGANLQFTKRHSQKSEFTGTNVQITPRII